MRSLPFVLLLLLLCESCSSPQKDNNKPAPESYEPDLSVFRNLVNFNLPDTTIDSTLQKGEFGNSKNNIKVFGIDKPIGWTNDFEHILKPEQISYLDSIITDFEKETTVEIAIVTLDSSQIGKTPFDDFVLALARAWGVGKKIKNNGIVIAMSSGIRKSRIEVGYGLEKIITDSIAAGILQDEMIPQFRNAENFDGIKSGLIALIAIIRKQAMP